MPDVQQRLLVHFLVLENREGGFHPLEQRVAWLIDRRVGQRIGDEAIGLVRKRANGLPGRPLR